MPLHELPRRDSWPPTQVHLTNDTASTTTIRQELLTAIDENPFAFFLTSPDEIDIDDYLSDDDLNAGIETPDSTHSPIREVSPSSLQRNPLPITDVDDLSDGDDEEYDFGFGTAIPVTLQDFTRNNSSGRKSRTGNYSKEGEKEVKGLGLGISLPEFSARGRARVRLTPTLGRRRGQQQLRMSRSLSARRPVSWTAPSPEIFSIREESDEDEKRDRDGGLKVDEEVYSVSAPASSRVGILASPGLRPKEKKRVHWAL